MTLPKSIAKKVIDNIETFNRTGATNRQKLEVAFKSTNYSSKV